ncbi:MAG: hypothetical protein ACK5LN_03950 [Propioniciclava sp.]
MVTYFLDWPMGYPGAVWACTEPMNEESLMTTLSVGSDVVS